MLTKNQFDVLTCIADTQKELSQRNISNKTNLSVGTVNKTIIELVDLGFLKDKTITQDGLNALEPYRVKKAIIIAAGLGSRLIPITLNTPKPLIRVKGKRILENTLEALTENGIEEIYLVRGY
ncbi:MAG: NTP transferase domain-containing protein, partial [Clostridia bacterium]|nr:NTP transferase domain-containing protein [Clostridia bacterium]